MKYLGKKLFVKQGETFSFSGAVLNKRDATPIDTLGLMVRSQIRKANDARDLIADLTCVWLDGSVVSIRFDGSTSAWPPGNALWDVQLVDQSDQVRVTETVEMVIERSVTAAAGG